MAPGSWFLFTASVLSSWNVFVWAHVTITLVPEKATVGGSVMLLEHSVHNDVLSFTWFRDNKHSSNQLSVIRPGDGLLQLCDNQSYEHVLMHLNGSLTLKNLSLKDSGLYLVKVNTLKGEDVWGEKDIQVYDEPVVVRFTLDTDSNQDSTIEVKMKSTVTFHCKTKSHPVISYHWTLNGSSLDNTGDQLILQNVSRAHQGIYTCSSHNKQSQTSSSAKVILRVVDSQDSSGTSQSGEINLIFLVATAVLAVLVIAGGLGCVLFIRNIKRASQKQTEDLVPAGESHTARIQKKAFHTYENDSQSRVLHTYENESQPAVLHTYENNPSAGDGMAATQGQSFASASSSTVSEKAYQDLDVTKVDVYDQIIQPRSQGGRNMSQR